MLKFSMSAILNQDGSIIGLQIGGTVEPNDRVGMHVTIPSQPSVGVRIEVNHELDHAIREVGIKLPADHPHFSEIKKLVDETLLERDLEVKRLKVKEIISLGANITAIATAIGKVAQLLIN